jgi:predicted ArsR family transcriptional regulator
VLASILIDAVLTERRDETAQQAVMRAAHERGRSVAAMERAQLRPGRLGAERALTLSEGLLKRHGYEPDRVSPVCVRLRNCPFHPVAGQSPELVCGLNHEFLTGSTAWTPRRWKRCWSRGPANVASSCAQPTRTDTSIHQ